jgi:hypothetical protein
MMLGTRSLLLVSTLAFGQLVFSSVPAASAQQSAAHDHDLTAASTDSATTAFTAAARAGAERYRDRDVAIASGFRPLGMDFPSMGEHWVNPGKVMAGKFDPADPAMLTYATIRGKVVLLGVVYAVPLGPGADPPALPGRLNLWHEHNGTVDEESMLPEHHSSTHSERSTTRLAILHLWLWVPNSEGLFSADNWSLPFVRLGLEPPSKPAQWIDAARALSLVSGGEHFYTTLMRESAPAGELSSAEAVAMRNAVSRVAGIAARAQAAGHVSDAQLAELRDTWLALVGAGGLLDVGKPH